MAEQTVRKFLQTTLKPLLPTGWKWVGVQRNLDSLSTTTVVWKQSRIVPLEAAPLNHVQVEGTLTVIDPHQDTTRAEEALDEAVLELVIALGSLDSVSWTEAQKVSVSDTNLGWDISISVIARKEN